MVGCVIGEKRNTMKAVSRQLRASEPSFDGCVKYFMLFIGKHKTDYSGVKLFKIIYKKWIMHLSFLVVPHTF